MNLKFLIPLFLALSIHGVCGTDHMDLFWNLYGAVVRGSRILHDVTSGVGAVSKAIAAIDVFLDVKPGETSTKDKTEDSNIDTATIQAKLEQSVDTESAADNVMSGKTTPAFNGCGALGFHINDPNLPVESMTECCITHDKCYNECGANKRECDSKLRSCLFSRCDLLSPLPNDRSIQKTCRSAAKILFSGTMALSFKQFNDAKNAQQCPRKMSKKRNKKR